MQTTRRVGLVVIALAAVAVWVLMAPPQPRTEVARLATQDYGRLIDQALADYQANDARADSAPKQQVTNGWVARDLLSIMALQQTDLLASIGALSDRTEGVASSLAVRDDRVPALLVLAVLAVCWFGITAPTAVRSPEPEPTSPSGAT